MGLRENLKEMMDSRGENPYSLSSKTKVPQPTIHRILDGTSRDPRRATLEPLARYFGVTVDALCGEKHQSAERTITAEQQHILALMDSIDASARHALIKAVSLLLQNQKPDSRQGVIEGQEPVESAPERPGSIPGWYESKKRPATGSHIKGKRLPLEERKKRESNEG